MAKLVQLAAASAYAITSVLILLFNKVILTTYSFKYPFTMALSHMVVGLLLLHMLKSARIITYAPFDITLAKKALPVSLCFIANVVIGMVALKGTNIPMFATLRRLTVMMVVLCEVLVLRKKQTGMTVISVTVMILGSLIGGWGDLQFDPVGYTMVMLNNLVTALNLVFIKKTLMDTKLAADTFGVLYYNSLISIPCLLLLSLLSGEAFSLSSFPHWSDVSFASSFLISACMSFLMNYSTYWCTEVNSALTTSVTGQVKNVLSSFVALSMFGMKATPLLVTGLTVGLAGSIMYAYAVYKQDEARKAAAAAKAAEVAAGTTTKLLSSPSNAGGGGSNGVGSSGKTLVSGGRPVHPSLSEVDTDLSLLTDGVVNHIHSGTNASHVHAQQKSNGHAHAHAGQEEADAKMHRLEAGQRSPLVTSSMGGMGGALVYPTNQPNPPSHKAVPPSPNPLHPYNQPHKSKPN